MKDNEKEHQADLSPESSEAKRNPKGAGRHPKSFYSVPVQEVLNLTAPAAARILQAHIERRRGYKNLPLCLQRACEYVIDHAIGKARQKIEHTGGILTYNELSEGAEKLEKHPRPVLADALEIAHQYQEKTAQDKEKPTSESQ